MTFETIDLLLLVILAMSATSIRGLLWGRGGWETQNESRMVGIDPRTRNPIYEHRHYMALKLGRFKFYLGLGFAACVVTLFVATLTITAGLTALVFGAAWWRARAWMRDAPTEKEQTRIWRRSVGYAIA